METFVWVGFCAIAIEAVAGLAVYVFAMRRSASEQVYPGWHSEGKRSGRKRSTKRR